MHKKKIRKYRRGLIDKENWNRLEQLYVCIIQPQTYNPEIEHLNEACCKYMGKFWQHQDFKDKDFHKKNY